MCCFAASHAGEKIEKTLSARRERMTRKYLSLLFFVCVSTAALAAEVDSMPSQGGAGDRKKTADPQRALTERANIDPALYDEIYAWSVLEKLPLDKDKLREFLQRQDEMVAAELPDRPPLPRSRTVRAVLEPGAPVNVIKVIPHFPVGLSFVDVTGKPWAISSTTLQSKHFSESGVEKGGQDAQLSNYRPVSATAYRASAMLLVTLVGQSIPVALMLSSDVDRANPGEVDSVVTIQVQARGPNAAVPVIGGGEADILSDVDPLMTRLVDNLSPPEGVKEIDVRAEGVRIWRKGELLYLRTAFPKVWPAESGVLRGQGDVRVYKLPLVPSLVLLRDGREFSVDTML